MRYAHQPDRIGALVWLSFRIEQIAHTIDSALSRSIEEIRCY
jgi:hypothetical protein